MARTLWELGRATVREVHEALAKGAAGGDSSMEFATVQTYLRRLEQKGYVTAKLEGRVRVYAPRVRPGTVIRQAIDDVVDRLFGGEALPLMRHLIEERGLSDDDLAQLRELLDRLDERTDEE